MGLRFRKRLKAAPGVRLNLGKRATSLSIDAKGLTLNVGRRRGRGASFSRHRAYSSRGGAQAQNSGSHNPALAIGLVLLAVGSVVVVAMFGS
jgi:hypothetical protein